MTTETILTYEQIAQDLNLAGVTDYADVPLSYDLEIARVIEQTVLQSEQVQAWKKDAQILDWLERHFTVVDGAYVDGNREAKIFHVDCEDDSFTEYKRNRIRDAVSAAMEKQP